MLVCPKKGAHLVKKTEQLRIFTPEQNIDADAYKFDYRIYYDVFVKKSGLDAIWAWISPEVNIIKQPESKNIYIGDSQTVSVTAQTEGATLTYQWYSCDKDGSNAKKIVGADTDTLDILNGLDVGLYYFYAVITVDGLAKIRTEIAEISVA
jgi:hypothetical protein